MSVLLEGQLQSTQAARLLNFSVLFNANAFVFLRIVRFEGWMTRMLFDFEILIHEIGG